MIIYQTAPQQTEHGRVELKTDDVDAQKYLEQILLELKQLNVQAAIITDNEVKESDV